MNPIVSLRKALADPELLGRAMPGPSWQPWHVLTIAAVGERLTADERVIFKEFTGGREKEPGRLVSEFWAIKGRRAGGSRAAATVACYFAALCDHSGALSSGERGSLPIVAVNTAQARRLFDHVAGILHDSPRLAAEIESMTADAIRLRTRVDIEIRPGNFRSLRGATCVGACVDEAAFMDLEGSANPDREILDALRPALATTAGVLWVISSPYARRGELWEAYKRDYGPQGDPLILVAKGSSKQFNSTLPQAFIDRAYERDASVAGAEWGAEFRTDIESFVSREIVESAIVPGRYELPPVAGQSYTAFVDPSGGSSDSMTLCIVHRDRDTVVVDAIRERRPPFSPDDVVDEFSSLLTTFSVRRVVGDRWGGEWVRSPLRARGIDYAIAEQSKSDLYRDLLPLLNSKRIELLSHPRCISQLCSLERRTARGGRDSIDHPPGAHDDVANALAGAIVSSDRDRRPSLIDEAALSEQYGAVLEMPKRGIYLVYATIATDKVGNVAATYCGLPRGQPYALLVFDVFSGPFYGSFFADVENRVIELQSECGAASAAICAAENLRPHIDDARVDFVELPEEFDPESSLVPVADWIAHGKAKVISRCMDKVRNSDFAPALLH